MGVPTVGKEEAIRKSAETDIGVDEPGAFRPGREKSIASCSGVTCILSDVRSRWRRGN